MEECVAVCCSMLQYAAVCCSVLQRVAVCCSVFQCVAAAKCSASLGCRRIRFYDQEILVMQTQRGYPSHNVFVGIYKYVFDILRVHT